MALQPIDRQKAKHQFRTANPKAVTAPAHMKEVEWTWADWPDVFRKLSESERKRRKARAKRKAAR